MSNRSSNEHTSLVGRVLLALGVCAVVALTAYELRFYFSGPVLEDIQPLYRVSDAARYELSFSVSNTTALTVNGREVVAGSDGEVDEVIYLSQGMNIIQILATDRYGKQKEIYLYITYPQ